MMLDYRQQKYALRLRTLPNNHLAKNILSIILRIDDENVQPKEFPEDDKISASDQKVRTYRPYLACQVSVQFCIDLADGVKPVINLKNKKFVDKISIQKPRVAILKAQRDNSDLALLSNGFKLKSRKVGIAVIWKNASADS